jgi:hypothetical protein
MFIGVSGREEPRGGNRGGVKTPAVEVLNKYHTQHHRLGTVTSLFTSAKILREGEGNVGKTAQELRPGREEPLRRNEEQEERKLQEKERNIREGIEWFQDMGYEE